MPHKGSPIYSHMMRIDTNLGKNGYRCIRLTGQHFTRSQPNLSLTHNCILPQIILMYIAVYKGGTPLYHINQGSTRYPHL